LTTTIKNNDYGKRFKLSISVRGKTACFCESFVRNDYNEKANRMRVPVSTYCRTKLTQDIEQ